MDAAHVHLCSGKVRIVSTNEHMASVHAHVAATSINPSTEGARVARGNLMTAIGNPRMDGAGAGTASRRTRLFGADGCITKSQGEPVVLSSPSPRDERKPGLKAFLNLSVRVVIRLPE